MNEKPKGFVPVMLTPFTDNGVVDYEGLTKLTEFYLNAGASGLFANCQSGEMFDLSDAERLAIARHVVRVADGAVPVVSTGTFGGASAQQADFVKRTYDTGVAAVVAITNMLAGASEPGDVLNERTDQLLAATPGIPLGFYECPEPFKRVLNAAQLKRFVDTGRVIYHKDTSLDIAQVRAKLAATQGSVRFGLYDAYAEHAVESLKAGAAGLSCIQGNFFPELITWLCRHYNNVALADEVARVQRFLSDQMDLMHHAYPFAAKYFLQKRGLRIGTFTRKRMGALTASVRNGMDRLFEEMCDFRHAM